MKIEVKNMVCRNCVSALEKGLVQLGHTVISVGLGYATIEAESLQQSQWAEIDALLSSLGFQRIVNPEVKIVEAVKLEVLRHVNQPEPCQLNLSHCIEEALGHDYKTVSRLFSAIEGRTIEKYYIAAKIEKAKELLSYGDLNLTEIAYRLGYSSVAFLSRQFKQETGMTPTQYLSSQRERRSLADI